jgi:hypothetical protein
VYVVVMWDGEGEPLLPSRLIDESFEAAKDRARAGKIFPGGEVYKLVGPLEADTVVNTPAERRGMEAE